MMMGAADMAGADYMQLPSMQLPDWQGARVHARPPPPPQQQRPQAQPQSQPQSGSGLMPGLGGSYGHTAALSRGTPQQYGQPYAQYAQQPMAPRGTPPMPPMYSGMAQQQQQHMMQVGAAEGCGWSTFLVIGQIGYWSIDFCSGSSLVVDFFCPLHQNAPSPMNRGWPFCVSI